MAKKKRPRKKAPKKRGPKKKSSNKKEKKGKKGLIGKIPSSVRIKGGKAKSKVSNKYGKTEVKSEYKDLEVS